MKTKINTRIEASKNEEKPPGKPPVPPHGYASKNTMPGGKSTVSVLNENGKKRTALPMGVSCRSNGVDGTMSVIVEAKSLLANGISEQKVYSTSVDNQTVCKIQVKYPVFTVILLADCLTDKFCKTNEVQPLY